ncbi:hypothetical protein A0H81_01192 [Grifola frondosa]|uniref:Uncharacterized protein n=1 Tax=Grifola frondosa TaxID=5627 RepID=A0A1C7MRM0_GRIFR|nr:hypothetical protein A0H81_01192 [Grifola frondosa]
MRLAGQTVMIDDEVEKPQGPDIAVPYTLNDYREVYTSGDAEMFEEELREVYGDDVDLEAHADDRSFLVRAWEMRHHDVVARMIRLLGSRCRRSSRSTGTPSARLPGDTGRSGGRGLSNASPGLWTWGRFRES